MKNLKMKKELKFSLLALSGLLLAGCTMEPDYERPETPLDAKAESLKEFKYAEGLWKEATPADSIPAKWWEIFKDEDLSKLIETCRKQNPNLKAAFQAVEQARYKARMTESELYPWADGNASWTKTGTSKNEASYRGTYEDYRIGLGLTWDLDLFGRVQALIKSDVALAEAQRSAYEAVMLMLETEVADTYFTIRQYNSEIKLLEETSQIRKTQVDINIDAAKVGHYSNLDVKRAQQQYYEAESQLAGVKKARAAAINYLAYITGTTPSKENGSAKELEETLPATPVVIPSQLLERRPDVAEAERKVFAANYRIGSAFSAFFPTVQITSSVGLASADIDSLLDSNSLAWGVSPKIYIPLFQAGRLIAQHDIALAEHLRTVEEYKAKVLFAIYEVETALSTIKILKDEYEARAQASAAAQEVKKLTKDKLDGGDINYFEFTDAERLALANERERIRLRSDQFHAIVGLIKSIGGSEIHTDPYIEKPAKENN